MSARLRLKQLAEKAPLPLALALARVPFAVRFGAPYVRSTALARSLNSASVAGVRAWAFPRLQTVVRSAYENTPFYRSFYKARGYDPANLKTFEHFQDVPIVTKADLAAVATDQRSSASSSRMLVNTGGTSGEPLVFYIDSQAFAREWAHMHLIWGRAGYSYRDLKLTMRGRNLGDATLQFNPVHNEYILNTYKPRADMVDAVRELLKRRNIGWIHGYPSIVSDVVASLEDADPSLTELLRRSLKGVLLGSEFPAPQYAEPIQRILGVKITSWYGHSEMCVLAYEESPNRYVPLHSYGFVEAVKDSNDGQRLLGTSYWNAASPFIRYDTGDVVSAETHDGIVSAFSIQSGRVGDFVIDGRGVKIPLTALIFGRHHAAFDRIRHVQVRQSEPGRIDLLIVPGTSSLSPSEIMSGFDFSDVDLQVTPVLLTHPVRSDAGKIRLLV